MMPGSPERVLLRNPNLDRRRSSRPRANAGASTSRSSRTSSSRTSVATAQGDLGLLVQVPRPAGHRGHRQPVLADDHPVRPRRGRSPSSSGLALGAYAGWRRGGAVDYVGNGLSPDPVFDAVLRARHDPARHLRHRPRLVPDLGHADARRDLHVVARPARSTSRRHLVLPLATVSLGLIGAVLDPDALVGHRDARPRTTSRRRGPRG